MIEFISSTQNPKIKKLLALQQKSSERRSEGLFVVEGRREIEHCIEAGFEIDSVFYCPAIAGKTPDQVGGDTAQVGGDATQVGGDTAQVGGEAVMPGCDRASKVFEVSPAVYDKIAYRAGTEGVVAEVKARRSRLEDLDLSSDPLLVVLESVEKPGNLGAVLRSADACGADAVIVCDPLTDLWNPNLIRSSIGAIFTVPTVACSSAECIDFLKAKGIRIFTAQLQDSELYYDTDFRGPSAIVMGTESTGLTDVWRKAADAHIRIPMLGRLDSLNVSVSAAILLFEAVRQRGV